MMKQGYSHLNNLFTKWINGTVSRPKILEKRNERCIQSHSAVDHVNTTALYVRIVRNIDGTLRQTDIHSSRQIHSELYDITCLINDIQYPYSCDYVLSVNRCCV